MSVDGPPLTICRRSRPFAGFGEAATTGGSGTATDTCGVSTLTTGFGGGSDRGGGGGGSGALATAAGASRFGFAGGSSVLPSERTIRNATSPATAAPPAIATSGALLRFSWGASNAGTLIG